ncbi:MAG: DUF2809 domain-containing protein [Planctomycetota bacterium]
MPQSDLRSSARSWRSRIVYATSLALVVPLGIASRRFPELLPELVTTYAGDTLWALAAYLLTSVIFPGAKMHSRALAALVFSYCIELSQLYHGAWIDAIRRTTLGGLVLGFGFLWSDCVCYAVGVALGATIEMTVEKLIRRASADRRTSATPDSAL